jgi:hypothetical protein
MHPRTISITLTIFAFVSWLASIYQARIRFVEGIGGLGIITVMPIAFFVPISLLTVSFLMALVVNHKNQTTLFCQVIMLILFLNLTPALIETTPRFISTYQNYQAVDYILQKGSINPSEQWIHNWPGFSIAYSILMQTTALPEAVLLEVYPTFFNITLFFALFIFFSLTINDKKPKWIALWTFYVANWVGQDYFSMQSLGFLAFSLVLFAVFKLMNMEVRSRRWSIMIILLTLTAVISHMLTSIIILAVFLVFLVSRNLRRLGLFAVLVAIFASWTIYCAIPYLQTNMARQSTSALNLLSIFQKNITSRVTGSLARIFVENVRLTFSALITAFALLGFMLTLRSRKMIRNEKRVVLILIGVTLPIFFFAYGGELIMRIFLFSLIPLVYFVAMGSRRNIFFTVLSIFLVTVVPPLCLIARYGNETINYVPVSQIEGTEQFYKVTTEGNVVLYPNVDSRYRASFKYFPLSSVEWNSSTSSLERNKFERPDWPRFVCISHLTTEFYDFYSGEPQFIASICKNLTESIHYNKVFSNPSFDVYVELSR